MLPLVVHSHYSLMQGTDSPGEICRVAAGLGYSHLALTDINNLYGLWPFLAACRRENIRPIIGAEILEQGDKGRRAVCLVENSEGYRNLCRLLSARHCSTKFQLASAVAKHKNGLLVLSDSLELLGRWRHEGVSSFAMLCGWPSRENREIRKAAGLMGVQAVAVPDSFFCRPADYTFQRLLRAISKNCSPSMLPPGGVSTGAFLAGPLEYSKRFAVWPETVQLTHALAERCVFSGPNFGDVLPLYEKVGLTPTANLRSQAFEGARLRYGMSLPVEVAERLDYELGVIEEKGFSSYFLLVQDIVKPVSRTCGRGSGAASLVAYCLGITNVCPIRFKLYFERFLNPGRTDHPDIDIDFAWDEREQVLADLFRKYKQSAAMVCNHVFFKPRMALRETSKVYGLSRLETDRLMKEMANFWRQSGEMWPKSLSSADGKGIGFSELLLEIIRKAQRLSGTPRYISVHPGGVILTRGPVADYVPVQIAAKGVPIIQWEKDGAEESGLIKIDILGNRSLGVVRDALFEADLNGQPLDELSWWPEEDSATQELVAKGQTMGCFYIESPAMRLLQKKSGRGDFEHLIIHSSIIRPAANEYIREYIRRLHGGAWHSPHPLMDEVLAESYGIMAYQEDVSRIAVRLAGFSHTDADRLRKIISKKDRQAQLSDFRERFLEGCQRHGLASDKSDEIWRMMMSFSGYSFCKPHSASYAKVSFQAAYIKAHFPAEFMAAVINNGGGFYSVFAYVSEARRLGLQIVNPQINKAEGKWRGKCGQLMVGFLSLKGVSRTTVDKILVARRERQFNSIADFIRRVTISVDEGRMLLYAGAFDELSPGSRNVQWWELLYHLRRPQKTVLAGGAISLPRPVLPELSAADVLRQEFMALGFLCKSHPISQIRAAQKTSSIRAEQLPLLVGKKVQLTGWLITGKLISTKTGAPMEFITFEDETSLFEATFFPRVYKKYGHLLESNRPFKINGEVEEEYGAVTLTVDWVERLA